MSLIETLWEGILVVSTEGKVVFPSSRVLEVLDCKQEALAGKRLQSLVSPEDWNGLQAGIQEAASGGHPEFQVTLACNNEAPVTVTVKAGVLSRMPDGQVTICLALTEAR